VLTGQCTGGIRTDEIYGEISEYVLRYGLPVGFWDAEVNHRLGERVSTFDISADVVLDGSRIDTFFSVETLERPTPNIIRHNSAAYDASSEAHETSGDGVLSVSHTASGTNRAAFAANNNSGGSSYASTSITYDGNSMSEQWDNNTNGGGADSGSAGYTIAGDSNVPASSVTVTGTLGGSPLDFYIVVASLNGVDSTTPVGTPQNTADFGSSASPSVTVTGLTTDGLIVDCIATNGTVGSSTHTIGSDQTSIKSYDAGILQIDTSYQSSNDGGVMSWGVDPTAYHGHLSAIEFLPSAAAAAGFPYHSFKHRKGGMNVLLTQ